MHLHTNSITKYHQDIITPSLSYIETWHCNNASHYHTDIMTPSVSCIITPAVSPRHHHTIPFLQIRPDIVRMQITIKQTSRHPPHHAPSHHVNKHHHTITATQTSTHTHQHKIALTQTSTQLLCHAIVSRTILHCLLRLFSIPHRVLKVNMWC